MPTDSVAVCGSRDANAVLVADAVWADVGDRLRDDENEIVGVKVGDIVRVEDVDGLAPTDRLGVGDDDADNGRQEKRVTPPITELAATEFAR